MELNNEPTEEPLKSRARKRASRWIAAVVFVWIACTCFVLVPTWGGSKASAMRWYALSDAKQLGLATLMYAEDADGRLPIANRWMDQISPLINEKMTFHAPGKQAEGAFGFAFRSKLSSVLTERIENPNSIALIFNSKDRRWNANGDLDLLPNPPEFTGKNVVCFADGHGAFVPWKGDVVR